MCTYDTRDNIRRYIGANKRKARWHCGRDASEDGDTNVHELVGSTKAGSRGGHGLQSKKRGRTSSGSFLDDQTTWMKALLGFGKLFAPPDAVAHACEAAEAIKHKPWDNDLIRSTANKIDKARGRARGYQGSGLRRGVGSTGTISVCFQLNRMDLGLV